MKLSYSKLWISLIIKKTPKKLENIQLYCMTVKKPLSLAVTELL